MRLETNSTDPLPILLVDAVDRETPITGATVTVELSLNGADFQAPAGTITETGGGWYVYTPVAAETATAGFLTIEASAPGSAVWRDYHEIRPDVLETIVPGDYPSGTAGHVLGSLSGGQVTIVSPVSDDGTELVIVRGDDYDADEGRAFEFTEVAGSWGSIDLEGATVSLALVNGGTALSYAGSVVTATGNTRKVRVELTSVQTAAIKAKDTTFAVVVTQANNRVATLVRGTADIR